MNRNQALGEDGMSNHAVQDRVRAALARAAARLRPARGAGDDLLRLTRSAMANAVTHPSTIGVWAEEGRVVLYGDVLAGEHEPLMRAIASVPGVTAVVDHLRQRTATDRIWMSEQPPELQSAPLNFNRQRWSPSTRIVGGVMGLTLLGAAIRDRRSLLATPVGAWGFLLLLRSIVNRPLGQLGPQRGVFEVSAATDIHAPVERVFRVISAWERFPTFMHDVRSVTRYDDGSSHWTVRAPLGALLEWDSVITVQRDNELLAWRSLPGSRSEQCGVISLEARGADQTRVRVHVTYKPPGGLVGHLAARAGGMDAGRILQNALERLKLFIEEWDMAGQGTGLAAARVAEGDSSLRATS